MKKTILSFAAIGALFASAATFEENLAAKDYAAAVAQLNWSTNITKLVTTAELANTLYEVAGTNLGKAKLVAHIALARGDNSVMQKYLDRLDGEGVTKNSRIDDVIGIYGQAAIDFQKTGTGWFKYTDAKGQEAFARKSLNDIQPEMMLKFYKRMAAAGKYDVASLAFWNTYGTSANGKPTELAPFVDAEWKQFLDETFTPEMVEKLVSASSIYYALFYFSRCDYMNGDAAKTISSKYCTPAALKTLAERVIYKYNTNPVNTKQEDFQKALTMYASDAAGRILGAKWLDRKYKTKNTSNEVFAWVVANGTWKEAADFALYIGDNDKVIDTFKKIGLDATPEQLNSFITIANALDVGYRTDDVKLILATINKKYTLKLYDDRDTWEPILSKVRALMEVL